MNEKDNEILKQTYFRNGFEKSELNDYEGAIYDYTKAIEKDPTFIDAYFNRGVVKDDLQDYSGAISDYTKVIEIDPSCADAYCYRAISNSKLLDDEEECLDKNGMFTDFRKAKELGSESAAQWLIRMEKHCREIASSNREDADDAAKILKEYFDNDIALKANGMIDIRFFQSFYTLLEGEEEKAMRSNDIAPAVSSSLFRIRGLFEPDDVLVNEELEEDFDLIKDLTNADEFKKWLKPQLEYQTQLSPIDSCLGTTFFIGDSEEMDYKTIDEFLMDMDYEKASNIVRDCFEKAKEALKNNP